MASIRVCDRCDEMTEHGPVWLWCNWHVFCPACLPAVLAAEHPAPTFSGPPAAAPPEAEPPRVKFREWL